MFKVTRTAVRASRLWSRCYATESSESPPLLIKIRQDLKLAMQNKDSTRLAVLKNILTRTTNASKTDKPMKTDMHMLELLIKSINEGVTASKQFKANGRQDLVDNEETQIKILKEYSAMVKQLSEDQITEKIQRLVDVMIKRGEPLKMGNVLKIVFTPEYFANEPVRKSDIVSYVKKILKANRKKDFTIPQPPALSQSVPKRDLAPKPESEVSKQKAIESNIESKSKASELNTELETEAPKPEITDVKLEPAVPEPEASDLKSEPEVPKPEISGSEPQPDKQ